MIIPRRKPYFPPNFFLKIFKFLLLKNFENEVGKLESDLSQTLGIKNPLIVSSGRLGLYLILKASNLKKGSEIIIPGYTFGMLTKFIRKAGLTPVPVDIDPDTFQMSVGAIKKSVNKKTTAILATHIFGEPCEINEIAKIARKNNLLLIEDCAESLGATVDGKLTGHFGNIALSSFNIAKPLQGLTGGLIFGKNEVLIGRIKRIIAKMPDGEDVTAKDVKRGLIGYFLSLTPFWPVLMYIFSFEKFRNKFVSGYRSQDNRKIASVFLPDYLAFLIRENLIGFKSRMVKRRKVLTLYRKYLGKSLKFQKRLNGALGNGYMIVAKTDKDPVLLRRHLALRGIDIAVKEEIADDCLKKNGSVVSEIFDKTVALPVYESLNEDNIKHISKAVKSFLSGKN